MHGYDTKWHAKVCNFMYEIIITSSGAIMYSGQKTLPGCTLVSIVILIDVIHPTLTKLALNSSERI